MPGEGVSRRELLKKLGVGGVAFIGGAALGHSAQAADTASAELGSPDDGQADEHISRHESPNVGSVHGHHAPPPGLGAGALDGLTFPQPADGKPAGSVREIEIAVEEKRIAIAHGIHFDAWTYNGSVPAPIIRATEGDLLRIRFRNPTGHAHSLHFHGAHLPTEDGWEPISPGGETTYEIEAGPPGVHPFHCHTRPLAEHLARGLYGMLIVDPKGGRRAAQEVALVLSGFSNPHIGRNGIVAWNGVAGYFHEYPITVEAGEPVRAYVVNMLEHEPVGSFHLHAQTFDVYPAGMGSRPAFSEDTITLGQGQRAIVEFSLPDIGRYMFHPHQHWLAERGAMGWLSAI